MPFLPRLPLSSRQLSRLTFSCLTSLCLFASDSPCMEAEPASTLTETIQINASAFGLRADAADNTDALRKALAACVAKPGSKLSIDTGVYRFDTAHFGADKVLALVQGATNLSIEGNGATFLFTGDVRDITGIRFSKCSKVRISNLVVDCERLPFAQGSIVSFDDSKKLVIDIDPRFPLQDKLPVESIVDCDPDTGLMLGNIDIYRSAIESVEKSPDGRRLTANIRLTVDVASPDRAREMKAMQTVLPGAKVLIRQATYGSFMFTFLGSSDITMENVTVHCFAGMAVHAQESANITLRKFVAAPPAGSGRLLSITKDAVHFTHTSGNVTIEDSRFDAVGDDGINVYAKYRTIKTVTGERSMEMIFPQKAWRGPLPAPGEILNFWDAATMDLKGKAEVATAVWSQADNVFRLTFRSVLPTGLNPDDFVSSERWLAGVVIRRCDFHGMLARAIVFSTCNVLIEDCKIVGTSYSGILFTAGLRHGFQGPAPRDVIIRNNEFTGTGGAAIYGYIFSKKPGNTAMANITIEGNKITANPTLDARRLKARRPDWLHWSAGICVRHATGVRIINNTWTGYPIALYLENIHNATATQNTSIATTGNSPAPAPALGILNRATGNVVLEPNTNFTFERDQKSYSGDLGYIGIMR